MLSSRGSRTPIPQRLSHSHTIPARSQTLQSRIKAAETIDNEPSPSCDYGHRKTLSAHSTPYPLLRIHNRSTKKQRALRDLVPACGGSKGFSALPSFPLPAPCPALPCHYTDIQTGLPTGDVHTHRTIHIQHYIITALHKYRYTHTPDHITTPQPTMTRRSYSYSNNKSELDT